ncbi:MAG: hypothetical protein KatS3mg027_0601 [Bacteroidia bacterium]|nr:MAG: hypothetical protein KatS3mg027_0601 [Bacteroidia bacterium]
MKLEAFASRFARTSDIFLKKMIKLLAQIELFEFQSLRDLLNIAEKKEWITDSDIWIKIREIRNYSAHDYSLTNYAELYQNILNYTPSILNDIKKIENYITTNYKTN